ncbi:DUF4123 domain-containing protein [Acinetobacter wuhouensis]|uniref:DUF4123 domain-containing protein n=1 Tax=Acinetobacter wuhouensis TaxID=1879050 RepID=UPI001023D7F6|nr:DUF4123 domain-containing protein [Acinetobacter wuhouensis]RZG70737.1 DUF4123 domain-containing protein [Acinetobacter wuhouensis]
MNIIEMHSKYDGNIYLIVDSIRVKEKIAVLNKSDYINLFDKTNEAGTPDDYSPILIKINNLNFKQEKISNLWDLTNVSSVIVSSLDEDEILVKLRNLMYVENENNSKFLYRWYDSRMVLNIDKLFSKNTLVDIFEGVDFWFVKKLDKNLEKYESYNLIEG